MNKLQLLIPLLLLVLIVLIPSFEVLAQCTGPHDPNLLCCYAPSPVCGINCPECVEIPLDGGLSALLLAGVAYGYKIIRKS